MKNKVKRKLARREPTIGNWIHLPSPSVVEILSQIEMDWLVLDTEHGSYGEEALEDMMRAMQGAEVTPIVRVAETNAALIKKALDRGAYGVICPLVNTAREAELAVSACKYPPAGVRGVAGTRASRYGLDMKEYYRTWNDEVLVICQIETREALENVREIAAVPGVDVLFIGPYDLSANLGFLGQIKEKAFQEAVARIQQAAQDNDVAVGYYAADAAEVLDRVEQGMTFVSLGSDVAFLAGAARIAYADICDRS